MGAGTVPLTVALNNDQLCCTFERSVRKNEDKSKKKKGRHAVQVPTSSLVEVAAQ